MMTGLKALETKAFCHKCHLLHNTT